MCKKIVLFVFTFFVPFCLMAQEKNAFSAGMSVDFTYHPHADYKTGDTHYSPLTGIYEGIESRVIGNVNYKIPTPLGEHWLVKDANVLLQANCELTVISFKPGLHIEFSPLPFLVFSAGTQIGTGWEVFGIIGAGSYNGIDKYNAFKPFESWFYKWYVQGTFQFDTGAIWQGDWTHFQIMYSYQVYYEGLSNLKNGDLWMWQATAHKVNGLCNYQNLILAYQMPLVLSRVGLVFELDGHYSADDFSEHSNYKGDFKSFGISPMCQFSFSKKDVLTVMLNFRKRRSFEENHTNYYVRPNLTYKASEWFFQRIVFSYSHLF